MEFFCYVCVTFLLPSAITGLILCLAKTRLFNLKTTGKEACMFTRLRLVYFEMDSVRYCEGYSQIATVIFLKSSVKKFFWKVLQYSTTVIAE